MILSFKELRKSRLLKLVIATRNQKKVEEIRRVTKGSSLDLQSLDEFPGCPEVVEDGETFRDNAIKKAVEVAAYCGCAALADDSGLVVDALQGAPGVFSARYAGPDATDQDNLEKLHTAMQPVADQERSARFVCVLAIADPAGNAETFDGVVEGVIAKEAQGNNGFGYDPLFVPVEQNNDGKGRTFAEMSAEEKDRISHRGRALAHFAESLTSRSSNT
ncbi:MAG: XTP/dITP diphosphatase [Magnetococcales bacterium]|nr:XTP/dITP diphosphatase [Magnetococcales bacterium]